MHLGGKLQVDSVSSSSQPPGPEISASAFALRIKVWWIRSGPAIHTAQGAGWGGGSGRAGERARPDSGAPSLPACRSGVQVTAPDSFAVECEPDRKVKLMGAGDRDNPELYKQSTRLTLAACLFATCLVQNEFTVESRPSLRQWMSRGCSVPCL